MQNRHGEKVHVMMKSESEVMQLQNKELLGLPEAGRDKKGLFNLQSLQRERGTAENSFQISSLQNLREVCIVLSHPVWGTLLWQHQETSSNCDRRTEVSHCSPYINVGKIKTSAFTFGQVEIPQVKTCFTLLSNMAEVLGSLRTDFSVIIAKRRI